MELGEFVGKFTANMLTELFKESLKGLKSFDEWIRDETKKYDLLGKGARAYGDKVFERYNQMQIYGQSKPKPLSDIYTYVNIFENLTNLQNLSPEELQKVFDKDSKTLGRLKETKYGLEVANSHEKLTVLGKAGGWKNHLSQIDYPPCSDGTTQLQSNSDICGSKRLVR